MKQGGRVVDAIFEANNRAAVSNEGCKAARCWDLRFQAEGLGLGA